MTSNAMGFSDWLRPAVIDHSEGPATLKAWPDWRTQLKAASDASIYSKMRDASNPPLKHGVSLCAWCGPTHFDRNCFLRSLSALPNKEHSVVYLCTLCVDRRLSTSWLAACPSLVSMSASAGSIGIIVHFCFFVCLYCLPDCCPFVGLLSVCSLSSTA